MIQGQGSVTRRLIAHSLTQKAAYTYFFNAEGNRSLIAPFIAVFIIRLIRINLQ